MKITKNLRPKMTITWMLNKYRICSLRKLALNLPFNSSGKNSTGGFGLISY